MGIKEAKKYIAELHVKQENPCLWPDFVTGLPDANAIVRRTKDYYPKLGEYAVAYIRIGGIQPYLIKYGNKKHQETIQWAAAILRTELDKLDGFVGVLGSHDFVAICKTADMDKLLKTSARAFEKKVATFYTDADREKGVVLSFKREGKLVNIGLMQLLYVTQTDKDSVPQTELINDLAKRCDQLDNY